MKKKIMHIVQSTGGVERYIFMLLKYMDDNLYEQILVCSQDYKKDNYIKLVDYFELVEMHREINLKKDMYAIIKIRKLIKKYKPDIIYLHSSKAGGIGRVANIGFKNKVIYNPHGWAFNMECSSVKKKLYVIIEKILNIFTDRIIAISNSERESAMNNKICSSDKIKVIFNGIDIEQYYINKKNFILSRKDLNIPENAYVIGMVGRISYQKAPDMFIKAAKLIKKEINNAYFIIVGDGDLRKEIEGMIREYGLEDCVLITGWVNNPLEYVQLFDQAMLLSRWEGFGLVLAEYMISEKSIIATNVDAIPNLIQDGINGLLVDVDNPYQVLERTLELYNNYELKSNTIENAKHKVKNDYDIKRVAKEHEILINNLLSFYNKKACKEESING